MELSVTLIVVIAIAALIYVFIELQRAKHKIFAIVAIFLLIFGYISVSVVVKQADVDLKTVSGLMEATKIYFAWMGSLLKNTVAVTGYAFTLDWGVSEEDIDDISDLSNFTNDLINSS